MPTSPHLAVIFNITDVKVFVQTTAACRNYQNWIPNVALCFLSPITLLTLKNLSSIKRFYCFSSKFISKYSTSLGTLWRNWLRHCATSRKVAGSIPDGVTGIFHWHNPSGLTMALGLTQPLTEMSTRNIFWEGKGGRCVGNRLSWNLWASTSWNPQGLDRGLLYINKQFASRIHRP
jgi:hypothetical protein